MNGVIVGLAVCAISVLAVMPSILVRRRQGLSSVEAEPGAVYGFVPLALIACAGIGMLIAVISAISLVI
jgi:hypothetical protein